MKISDLAKFPAVEPEVLFDGGRGASEAGWHSIESFWRCPKEYQLRHIRGLRKPAVQTPDHFAWGILHHAGRARWFTRRFATDAKTWQEIVELVREEAEAQKLPVSLNAEQNALVMLEQYIEHWSTRPSPTPLAAEYKLGPTPLAPDDSFMLWRTARLDDVSQYPEALGKVCIGESKTTSTSVNDCVNQYTLHGQTMLQFALYHMDPRGERKLGKAEGIMLDVAVKGYGGKRCSFERVFVEVPEFALKWYVKELQKRLRAAAQIDWDSDAERNVAECTRMAGRARIACEFREACARGKAAASLYVDRQGDSLVDWQKKRGPGKEKAPWD